MLDLRFKETNYFPKRDEEELPEEDEKRCRRLFPLTSESLEVLSI